MSMPAGDTKPAKEDDKGAGKEEPGKEDDKGAGKEAPAEEAAVAGEEVTTETEEPSSTGVNATTDSASESSANGYGASFALQAMGVAAVATGLWF
jgi:hypothetical protein